ncbi:hypothetical protein FHW58_003771 [Duganella sp. 1224]|uniref:hypothetical protein n=1 Tax=Duganella sp. 1224 TaxID=2587052 RepID=UPI0015CE16FB|nr:hypothetical protein [Duganella sp. 1224]NYE62552.1 hypothetical protein [Duganella sp. 1224]
MSDLEKVSLTVAESGLPHATDQFFSALMHLVGIKSPHKLALLGSITSYEIVPDAPMFNQYIFRSWVDRSIYNSPSDPGSPSFYARHSNVYRELLTRSTAKIEATIPAAVQAEIDTKMQVIGTYQEKIEDERMRVNEAWKKYAASAGLTDPKSHEYVIASIGFRSAELAFEKLSQWRKTISRLSNSVELLRATVLSPEDRTLLAAYEYTTLEEFKMKRPKTAGIESAYKLDEVMLGDFDRYGIPSSFEDGQDILPSIDLEEFLKRKGARSIIIERNSQFDYRHEDSWSGSGGGSFGFLSLNVNAGSSSTFTETVKRIGKLELNFENIAEVFAIRGPWFSLAGLTHPVSRKELARDPKGLAVPLTYLVQSAIIARGLTLTVHFDNSDDWDKFTQSSGGGGGGGGGSIFGISIGGGGGGGGESTEKSRDRASSTITFGDDSNQCRILGFRLQPMLEPAQHQAPVSMLRPWMNVMATKELDALMSLPAVRL